MILLLFFLVFIHCFCFFFFFIHILYQPPPFPHSLAVGTSSYIIFYYIKQNFFPCKNVHATDRFLPGERRIFQISRNRSSRRNPDRVHISQQWLLLAKTGSLHRCNIGSPRARACVYTCVLSGHFTCEVFLLYVRVSKRARVFFLPYILL